MNYIPEPIETNDIVLPRNIQDLAETLAKNTHEVWSAQRIREGWSYGETRDDDNKFHPCLVEYEKLSESEKEYDRITALETLKVIMQMGYQITK